MIYICTVWFGMILSTLMGVVDGLFLSIYSDDGIIVSGASTIIFSLLVQFFIGYAISVNKNISKKSELNLFHLLLFLIIALFFSIAVSFSSNEISLLLFKNIPAQKVASYLSPLVFSLPFSIIIFTASGICRGIGKPVISVYFNILVLLSNCILNYIFIIYRSNIGFDSVSSAVAWSTFWSDACIGSAYFIILMYMLYHKITFSFSPSGLVSLLQTGLEKVFSNGTLFTVQTYFASLVSVSFFSTYIISDRFLMPFMIFGHALHEWVIHSKRSNVSFCDIYKAVLLVILLTLLITTLIFITLTHDILIYIFCLIVFLHWIERYYIGILHVIEKSNLALKVISCSKTTLSFALFMFFLLNHLNSTSFLMILILWMIIQNIILHAVIYKNQITETKVKILE